MRLSTKLRGEVGGSGWMMSKHGTVGSFIQMVGNESNTSQASGSWVRKWAPTFQTIVFLSNPLCTRFFHRALQRRKKSLYDDVGMHVHYNVSLNNILSKCPTNNRWLFVLLPNTSRSLVGPKTPDLQQALTRTVGVALFQLGATHSASCFSPRIAWLGLLSLSWLLVHTTWTAGSSDPPGAPLPRGLAQVSVWHYRHLSGKPSEADKRTNLPADTQCGQVW